MQRLAALVLMTAFAGGISACERDYAGNRMNADELRTFEKEQRAKLEARKRELYEQQVKRGREAEKRVSEERAELTEKRRREANEAEQKLEDLARDMERDSPSPPSR